MNEKVAKKLRKYTKRRGQHYVATIRSWPFRNRLRFAWSILFGGK